MQVLYNIVRLCKKIIQNLIAASNRKLLEQKEAQEDC